MQGAGRATGEPAETAWAETGRLGLTTQYAAAPTRMVRLEHAFHSRNTALRGKQASLLLRLLRRAQADRSKAKREQEQALARAAEIGVSPDQVRAQWQHAPQGSACKG